MTAVAIQKREYYPIQKPLQTKKKRLELSDTCLSKLQLLSSFSQSALDLLGASFYKHVKATKQVLQFIRTKNRCKKLFKLPFYHQSLECTFNKTHAAASLVLIPITLAEYGSNLISKEVINSTTISNNLHRYIKSIAPHAIITLAALGLIKTAFSIRNLLKEIKADYFSKKKNQKTTSWQHNSALALAEGMKLSFSVAKMLSPQPYTQAIKTCYNVTILALSPLHALKLHQKQRHTQAAYSIERTLSEILSALQSNCCKQVLI